MKNAVLSAVLSASDRDCPTCLVALSGGADSVALLHSARCGAEQGAFRLGAVHVHHGIRAQEADADAAFCEQLCKSWKIPFFLQRVDALAYAKAQKVSVEQAARDLRYEALEKCAQEYENALVLTAHHQDDQMETVLLRLLRGTSPEGLCGIPAKRDRYLRPLLSYAKQEILAYCKANSLAYVEDSTNTDLSIPRNYLRAQIIPLLRQKWPKMGESVTRTTQWLCEQQAYLQQQLCALQPTMELSSLRELPRPLLHHFLAQSCYEQGVPHLSSTHLVAIEDLLQNGTTGQSVSLPADFVAYRSYDCLQILPKAKQPLSYQIPLQTEGWTQFPDGSAVFCTDNEKVAKEMAIIYKFETSVCIDSATIVGKLFCRPRQNADTIRQGEMTRSVKNLFQTKKIDTRRRAHLPFLCDAQDVVWIPFVGIADKVASPLPKNPLYLMYCEEKKSPSEKRRCEF